MTFDNISNQNVNFYKEILKFPCVNSLERVITATIRAILNRINLELVFASQEIKL